MGQKCYKEIGPLVLHKDSDSFAFVPNISGVPLHFSFIIDEVITLSYYI